MEFANLGKHCTYCSQKDFLPILCHHCNKYYCKNHMTQESHECPIKKEEKKRVNYTKYKKKGPKCIKCRKRQDIDFYHECKYCYKPTCMTHRFPDDHNCSKDMSKQIITDVKSKSNGMGQKLLDKLRKNKY